MNKILNFKTTLILLGSLTVLLVVNSFLTSDKSFSRTTICREIKQGNYQHVHYLFKPSSTLNEVNLDDTKNLNLNAQQLAELTTISTDCTFRTNPLFELFFLPAEALENKLNINKQAQIANPEGKFSYLES